MSEMNPWHPMTDAVAVKHLGKLGEEAGELCAAVSRCIIQGIDDVEPVTGKVNSEWLEDEIADVLANIHLVREFFKLDAVRIEARIDKKIELLRSWHKMA